MRSVELFSGCGGLALGLSRAGFHHDAMAERDADAVATVEYNRAREVAHVKTWPALRAEDVRGIDWRPFRGAALVAGGPPCQPFGIGGKKVGHGDARDMWPEAVRAVREIAPNAFLFENVRNLAGPAFKNYLDWITAHLAHPEDTRQGDEDHAVHVGRLRAANRPPAYAVSHQVVNAADHGASQVRHRVLVAGIRSDFGVEPGAMRPTHSCDRLLWDQWITGEYWHRHGLVRPDDPANARDQVRVRKLRVLAPPPGLPWVTVRDAIAGLGEPDGQRNHVRQEGARVYAGHTGSQLDMPAKALKAGDHGVPGGENMMVLDGGGVRYFTTREAARLVGLPDDYLFPRSWTETMRQLGNAVPAQLGEAAGRWLAETLRTAHKVDSENRRRAA